MTRSYSMGDEQTQTVSINISPLIDVVFLLLIFFVVTTTFVESTGLKIDKPTAVTAENLKNHTIMLALGPDGRIYYGGQEISMQGVRGIVARQIKSMDRSVVIVSDKRSASGVLIQLLDECRRAGAKNVSVATEKDE